MKIIRIAIFGLLLFKPTIYAIDEEIGQVSLSQEQLRYFGQLKSEKVKGFKYQNGQLTVTTETHLNQSEKETILNEARNFVPVKPQEEMREEELKQKPVLSLPELTELLRLKKII